MPWSELTSLGSLTIECCIKLKTLPRGLGKLGALKQLTLAGLGGLEVLPHAVVRLTMLGSLTIECCGKLGALKQLTLLELDQLQEMPDLIGLTALDSLTIVNCFKLKKPRPPPSPDPSGRRGACAKTLVRSHGEGQR